VHCWRRQQRRQRQWKPRRTVLSTSHRHRCRRGLTGTPSATTACSALLHLFSSDQLLTATLCASVFTALRVALFPRYVIPKLRIRVGCIVQKSLTRSQPCIDCCIKFLCMLC